MLPVIVINGLPSPLCHLHTGRAPIEVADKEIHANSNTNTYINTNTRLHTEGAPIEVTDKRVQAGSSRVAFKTHKCFTERPF